MTTTPERTSTDKQPDLTAKTRVIVGSVLLLLAWLLAAATVVALMVVLPRHQVDDYAAWIIVAGLFTAAAATYALITDVINRG